MRIALCTTTINIPTVLELYRKLRPEVEFFIAGDLKSPHVEIDALCQKLVGAHYIHPNQQKKWKCSELLGWNCIQRRNIAYLEALAWGADIIYSWDDDNLPLSHGHFDQIAWLFPPYNKFCGFQVGSPAEGWFDPGSLLVPPAKHRGIPYNANTAYTVSHTTDAKIGVAAGMCLGDPDVDAVTRMERAPVVHGVSELLNAGIVVDARCRTVFNTQNSAFLRELAPAMLLVPQFKRYDDIIMSLICRRVMAAKDLYVHYGKPFTFQERNEHDLTKDLENELWGMQHIERIADWLVKLPLDSKQPVIELVREIYDAMFHAAWTINGVKGLADAWLDDCEQVMG